MAEPTSLPSKTATATTTSGASATASVIDQAVTPSQPQEQLQVEEPNSEDNTIYPSGVKLWLDISAFFLCVFVRGVDLTIVAVAVPSLTNEFNTINDIGWYNAAYMMTSSATIFFFGKVYTLFELKLTYLSAIFVYWLGSIICTFANSSKVFILGRAVCGFANAWGGSGLMTYVNITFPLNKRPTYMGLLNFVGSAGLVTAPLIGGLLIQWFSWRACFGINIPLNALCFAFTAYSMRNPPGHADTKLPLLEKIKRLDLTGTLIFIPAITCLLMALQWGGTKYGWNNPRIIVLIILAVVLLGVFAFLQYYFGEKATLPPRILKNRSILAGAWFCACCDGTLAVTEQYLAIYFQGVRGLSPAKSGLLGVPMIVGLAAASMVAGLGTSYIGYYTPFMIATSVLSPIASGLLTTLDLDSDVGKAAGLLGLLGFALGVGMQGPFTAVSCILKPNEVSIGGAILGFGAGMGSAMFTSAGALLFQGRLRDQVSHHAPNANITSIERAGLSEIRNAIGRDQLKNVLTGYDKAVVQTLYLPMGLTLATIVGTSLTEWRSVKKKQN